MAFKVFMQEALPDATEETRLLAVDLLTATLSRVGKDFSTRPQAIAEVDVFAGAMADMFCAYLDKLGRANK